ncbi:3-hydroxybutyrate oligomer hydrolase family protein [Paraburkholderia dipogonis]|uniref:3-hydroxybutyrate oligomer hydrolase family protein n=1 Tax=Paraburkholderia dipogonis TaxID=1211383 RepID=UPI0035EDBEAC
MEAIQFAYWALNDSYGTLNGSTRTVRYAGGSITTIAASVSNGGGASLAAAEQDTSGWITAVVVGEPADQICACPRRCR